MGLCCGPRFDDKLLQCCACCKQLAVCHKCFYTKHVLADTKVRLREWFDCCGWCEQWHPRFSGFQLLCAHFTCVLCPAGCEDRLCCEEELMMMDGDLKPVRAPAPQTIGRGGATTQAAAAAAGGAAPVAARGGRGGVKQLDTKPMAGRAKEYTEAQRKADRQEEFKIKGRPFVEIEVEFGLSRRLM